MIDTTTLSTLLETLIATFPDGIVSETDEGEIIISTGLYSVGDPETPLITQRK